MALVKFVTHDGDIREVHVEPGTSLMHAAVDNGIDAVVAECGGACSCATCHVYIDERWIGKLEGPGEIEKEMLDCVLEPADNSRLGCQVKVTEELDGIIVRLPESQF